MRVVPMRYNVKNCRRTLDARIKSARAASRGPRTKSCQKGIGAQKQFRAEAASYERGKQPDVFFRNIQRQGKFGASPIDHLV